MGTQDSYTSMYIYMYMYIGFPLSIINVVLINVVITLYTQEWSRTPVGPQKTRRAKKKDLKSQTSWNSVSWIGSIFQQLPSWTQRTVVMFPATRDFPGPHSHVYHVWYQRLKRLTCWPHFEKIPVIVGIPHILLAMGPSSYYWYHLVKPEWCLRLKVKCCTKMPEVWK